MPFFAVARHAMPCDDDDRNQKITKCERVGSEIDRKQKKRPLTPLYLYFMFVRKIIRLLVVVVVACGGAKKSVAYSGTREPVNVRV